MVETTFLFTDIEGSTRLWEQQPRQMSDAVAWHDALLREIVLSHDGKIVKFSGDGIHAAFSDASQALTAAVNIQCRIREMPADYLSLALRCGLHIGPAESRDGDYFGTTVNRAARLCHATNGGQIIISAALNSAIADSLPSPLSTRCLGTVRLRDLTDTETVHQLLHPDLPNDFAPLRTLATSPNNLPFFANAFIGRYREIGETAKLVAASRLVTLLGVGGLGKTRLAIQAAAHLLDQFPEGVWLCELATINDATFIPLRLMQILNIKAQASLTPTQHIIQYCNDKKILLVLDNCEHLIDGVAQFCAALLQHAPAVQLLATSREGIEIDGETAYQLPVLSIPDPDFYSGQQLDSVRAIREVDSVRLFLDRALRHRPDFELHSQDVPVLARICYRLDGIPLAIELAAARLRTMTLAEIDHGLDNRFGFLVTGSRVAAPRHKTLHATLAWSYDLLSLDEQAQFVRLAVFVGGATFAAVAHVCAATTAVAHAVANTNDDTVSEASPHSDVHMQSLVDKSMIDLIEVAGRMRFTMLETLRQFALEKVNAVGEWASLSRSHAKWYRQFAIDAAADFYTDHRLTALQRLDLDQANLRSATHYLIETNPLAALDMCVALGRYWLWRGQFAEAKALLESALAAQLHVGAIPEIVESKARYFASGHCYMMSDLVSAETHARLALAASLHINDDVNAGSAMAMLGHVMYIQYGHAASQKYYEDGIALSLRGGDIQAAANNMSNLANNAAYANDVDVAAQYLAALGTLAAQHSEPFIQVRLVLSQGQIALHRGYYAEAEKWLQQYLTISKQMSDKMHEGISQFLLGAALTGLGALSAAADAFTVSINSLRAQDARIELCNAIEAFAFWCSRKGDDISAVKLCASTLILRDSIGFPVGAQARESRRRALASSEENLDDYARADAQKQGSRMTLAEAATLACALVSK